MLLRGIIAPILTPFNDDLSIADDLFLALAKSLINQGCVGLAPFGTTGEALSIGIEERIDALNMLVDGGIDPARLIPGTGLANFTDSARLTRAAVDLGCAGEMILPPFYYKIVSDDGLYDYYAKLIDLVAHEDLRIYLYHIPQVAGVGLSVNLVKRLKQDFPQHIIGIKDSSGDWHNTAALLKIKDLTVYPGNELRLLDGIDLGSAGCITATANINAPALAEAAKLMFSADHKSARQKIGPVIALRKKIQSLDAIPAQKALLALAKNDARYYITRPPLQAFSPVKAETLKTQLRSDFGFHL